jgi:hypothetical protein
LDVAGQSRVVTSVAQAFQVIGFGTGYSDPTNGVATIYSQSTAAAGGNVLKVGSATNPNTFVAKDNGNVGIGTANPGAKLQVGVLGDGSVALANAWNLLSDERLKRDFEIIRDSLEKILSLNGYYYYWNRGTDTSKKMGG